MALSYVQQDENAANLDQGRQTGRGVECLYRNTITSLFVYIYVLNKKSFFPKKMLNKINFFNSCLVKFNLA